MPKLSLPIIISIVVCIALASLCMMFYVKSNHLNSELNNAKQTVEAIKKDLSRLNDEKKSIIDEKEKLQADTVSYLGLNTKLEQEKANLKKQIESVQKKLDTKEGDLQRERLNLQKLEKERITQLKLKNEKSSKEDNQIKKKLSQMKTTLKAERALYHYNLAVAYTQANLYDEAIEAYKKSLEFDKTNPDAYYNLGLIYKDVKQDPDNAIDCYSQYLKLKPDADDKEEVEALISSLKQ